MYYVFFSGNHEYYTGDVDNWLAEISKLNVTPLTNQRVCLPPSQHSSCKGKLYLAGLEDLATRNLKYVAGPNSNSIVLSFVATMNWPVSSCADMAVTAWTFTQLSLVEIKECLQLS